MENNTLQKELKSHNMLYWIFLTIIILVLIDLFSGAILFDNANAGIVGFTIATILKLFIPQESLATFLGTIISLSRVVFVIAIPIAIYEKRKIDSLKKQLRG